MVVWQGDVEPIEKGQKGTYLGNGDAFQFVLGGISIGLDHYQNLLTWTLRIYAHYLYISHIPIFNTGGSSKRNGF